MSPSSVRRAAVLAVGVVAATLLGRPSGAATTEIDSTLSIESVTFTGTSATIGGVVASATRRCRSERRIALNYYHHRLATARSDSTGAFDISAPYNEEAELGSNYPLRVGKYKVLTRRKTYGRLPHLKVCDRDGAVMTVTDVPTTSTIEFDDSTNTFRGQLSSADARCTGPQHGYLIGYIAEPAAEPQYFADDGANFAPASTGVWQFTAPFEPPAGSTWFFLAQALVLDPVVLPDGDVQVHQCTEYLIGTEIRANDAAAARVEPRAASLENVRRPSRYAG